LFVRSTKPNAERIIDALDEFGFRSLGIEVADFVKPNHIVQLGVEPFRIDIVTGISGVTFDEAWADRVEGNLAGLPVKLLSQRMYRKNKRASGRVKDLADLETLPDDPIE
jgi:hypothetical protein